MEYIGNYVIENPLRPVIQIKVEPPDRSRAREVLALVDTGAMGSAVSRSVAEELGLECVGEIFVAGATSERRVKRTLKSARLVFQGDGGETSVVDLAVLSGLVAKDYDVIIGMDILSKGDMVISNKGGQMWVSLRFPPSNDRIWFR